MKKKSKIILSILAVILLLVVGFAVAVASALHIEVDYDDPESLADVAGQAECYLIMTHPDTDSPELQAALKELDDIALLDVPDEEKIKLIRARFPEESFWPDELKDLLRSAESGDRDAQYRLDCLYLNDGPLRASAGRELMKYVVPNPAQAEKWLLKAARQGHADAQYRLAKCYEEWHPVSKNKFSANTIREGELIEAEKEQWLKIAARNGNMYALLRARGNSVDVRDRARSLIRKAAEQGDAVALEFDRFEFEHTYKCLLKNAENGSVFAMWKYAGLCGHGITEWVKDRTFSSERKKEVVIQEPDAELAKQWRRKALDTAMKHLEEDSDPRDFYTIASLYDPNFSPPFMGWLIDEKEMADLADRIVPALWNADPACLHTFSLLFDMHNARKIRGLETEDDAVFLRKLVKHCGLFHYRLSLARSLLEGTEEDKAEAVGLLRHLAGLGDPRARELLGQCYLDGTGGLPKDKAEAVKWFRKAAEQRVYSAMESLAVCLKAPGDPHDEREAERWEWFVKERCAYDSKLEMRYIQIREPVRRAWIGMMIFVYNLFGIKT